MRESKIKYRFDGLLKELTVITRFTLPSFLSGLSITPPILIANMMLAHQNNGYYQLGVFNAAYFISIITSTLNGVIGQVLYPFAMQQFNKKNRKFEYFNIISPWVIGIVLNLPLIIFPEVIVMFFGDKYDSEDFRVSIMLIAMFSIIISHRQGIARNFAAANLMWWSVLSNTFWGIALITCIFQFLEYGSIGLAFSFLISYVLNSIVFVPLYLKKELIKKKLLISVPLFIIWVIIFTSPFIYFFIKESILKIGIIAIIIAVMNYLFLITWRNYNAD
jgi:O-antigen/teichoic acid export membrane protein